MLFICEFTSEVNNMESYIVYMHVNKIDGKKYVGITCYQNPERRWINGKGYFRNQYFSRAINKYGWNNFEHTIVARGLSHDEACSIERMMIQSLQTQDRRFGYNKSQSIWYIYSYNIIYIFST